ncbi:hypothetical protein S245_071413 [Arachis hypogaea]|uniref:Uncharacterized protein n=1 Tax=Arachis hypogaea TaxID=3818 RepID=A0A444X7J9_ARAHY|nr:uncharacterized protein DS421_20g704340 [Arachis hypogaea]RYQ85667.1 hypothetical protein Ahy_B10g105243 [Arachis hypogaea]
MHHDDEDEYHPQSGFVCCFHSHQILRQGDKERLMVMESTASICSNSRGIPFFCHSSSSSSERNYLSPLIVKSMATQKPLPLVSKTVSSRKNSTVFPIGEQPRSSPATSSPPVKLLTRMEQLRLLSKAEKAGLLSAAENLGFSLSKIEQLGLLSKAEEFGVLSAATDPGTPGTLLTLSLGLLLLGPFFVYLVPEDNLGDVAAQLAVALICVLGGSAAFAASNFVSNLQKSK